MKLARSRWVNCVAADSGNCLGGDPTEDELLQSPVRHSTSLRWARCGPSRSENPWSWSRVLTIANGASLVTAVTLAKFGKRSPAR